MVLFHLHLRSIALHVNGYEITLPAPPEYCRRAAVGLIMACCTCILEQASLMLLMTLCVTRWLVTSEEVVQSQSCALLPIKHCDDTCALCLTARLDHLPAFVVLCRAFAAQQAASGDQPACTGFLGGGEGGLAGSLLGPCLPQAPALGQKALPTASQNPLWPSCHCRCSKLRFLFPNTLLAL